MEPSWMQLLDVGNMGRFGGNGKDSMIIELSLGVDVSEYTFLDVPFEVTWGWFGGHGEVS